MAPELPEGRLVALTQKQKVLGMLRAAGRFGVRSDTYLAEFIPRAAARICELREDGWEITSEREHQFVRYTLQEQRGVADVRPVREGEANPPGASAWAGNRLESTKGTGQAEELGDKTEVLAAAPEERSVPSMFDPDADWNEAA